MHLSVLISCACWNKLKKSYRTTRRIKQVTYLELPRLSWRVVLQILNLARDKQLINSPVGIMFIPFFWPIRRPNLEIRISDWAIRKRLFPYFYRSFTNSCKQKKGIFPFINCPVCAFFIIYIRMMLQYLQGPIVQRMYSVYNHHSPAESIPTVKSKLNYAIHWIVIYPVDCVVHFLND